MLGRKHSVFLAMILVGVCASKASAQRVSTGMDTSQVGNVSVHVENPENGSAGLHLRVRLMKGAGSTQVAESFTNQQGVTQFAGIPVGEYHILVSGDDIQEADSGEFEIDRRKLSQSVFITVHSTKEASGGQPTLGLSSVSKTDLATPDKARKEYERATKAMAGQDWPKAVQHFQRAIDIYPDYAMAYTNLGVAYGHLNQPQLERESFQKAIKLDSHFASPYVNLAKLCLREQDASQAETLLDSANRAEPNNPETMTLLAQAELLTKHFDAAIRTAQDVHSISHPNFAVVHYIAARAYERSGRSQEAIAQLELFLTEESSGSRADHVRDEIAHIKSGQP